jgi:type I restriction enzyme S subunit
MWRNVKLKDLCSKIGSGATPKGGKEAYHEEGISLIRSQNILDFTFSKDGLAFIDETQAKQLSNVEVQQEDILLNITGDSVARVCQVPNNVLPARVNQHVAIIRPLKDRLNPEYLKYYLLNPPFKNYMLGLASSGATRNALTKVMIEDFDIALPDLPTQTRIAEILSSLDDKIELNRRMNQTLEAIAQTLFKEWFVNFNFPGFNGELVDGLPKGWQMYELGDVSTLIAGGDKPKNFSSQLNEEFKVPIYSNGITNEGLYGYTDLPRIYEESVTVSARGTIGYVCLRMHPYVPIVRLIAIIPHKKLLSSKYLYLWLKNQNISGTGTTQQQLTVPDFKSTKILIPEIEIIKQFTAITNSIFEQIYANQHESLTLNQLRDSLLPKLMRGELLVPQAVELVEETLSLVAEPPSAYGDLPLFRPS